MSSELQNKLLNYEVQPPEGVWDKVAASLDENMSFLLTEKLYQYEETPSPAVWQNLVAQLDVPVHEKTKIIPFYIRYSRPLKYSGAVAVLIFLAVFTSLLISKKAEPELPAESVANTNSIKKDTVKSVAGSEENNPVTQQPTKDQTDRLIARAKIPKNRNKEPEPTFSFIESFLPKQAERNEMISSTASPDKYMIYSDGDGNVIRLPKKVFSAFACPDQDIICKQRLQQLREKFASSAMTVDFTGLLEILKSLQENQ